MQSSSVSSGDGAHRKACEGQKEGLNPGFLKGAGMSEPLPNPGWERGSLEPQLLLQQCWPSNEAVPAGWECRAASAGWGWSPVPPSSCPARTLCVSWVVTAGLCLLSQATPLFIIYCHSSASLRAHQQCLSRIVLLPSVTLKESSPVFVTSQTMRGRLLVFEWCFFEWCF